MFCAAIQSTGTITKQTAPASTNRVQNHTTEVLQVRSEVKPVFLPSKLWWILQLLPEKKYTGGKSHQDDAVKRFELWSGWFAANRTSVANWNCRLFWWKRDFWRNVVRRMVDVIFLSRKCWKAREFFEWQLFETVWISCLQWHCPQQAFTEDTWEGRGTCSAPQSTDPERADSTCCQWHSRSKHSAA